MTERDRQSGKGLARREFETVIRRAAELSSSDSGDRDGELSETELFRMAGEVGLSGLHVRQALDEMRSGLAFGGGWNDGSDRSSSGPLAWFPGIGRSSPSAWTTSWWAHSC